SGGAAAMAAAAIAAKQRWQQRGNEKASMQGRLRAKARPGCAPLRPTRVPAPGHAIRPAMSAKILDGKALAARIKDKLALEVDELRARGVEPGLAVVLVCEDPASQIYVRTKPASCAKAGIRTFDPRLPATTSQ